MDSLTLTTHERNLKLWLSRIRDFRASGQKVSCWCEHNGVCIKSYYYWMREIKREAFETLPEKQKIKVQNGRFQWAWTQEEVRLISDQEFRWLLEGLS